jgi:TorA maturation chaperone TorD
MTAPPAAAETLAAAAGLLAHWWSRPVPDEVGWWLDAAETGAAVRRLLRTDPGGDEDRLPYDFGQVPALLDEYERLFVGPAQVPCPPYESFWRDDVPIDLWHSLMGPCTADLRRLYRELGIDIAPAAGELPDHVAVEFEALAFALCRADGDRVAAELVSGHLSRWLPRLCKKVAAEAGHPFYAGLAPITADWLGHIERYLAPPAAAGPAASGPAAAGSGAAGSGAS